MLADGAWRQQQLRRHVKGLIVGTVSTGAIIALWYIATAVTESISPLFLPSPTEVVGRFVKYLTTPYYGETIGGHVLASVKVVVLGWAVGGLIGLPVGVMMGWSPRLRTIVGPLFAMIRPIPPIAWIPLAILWFGLGTSARVFVVALSALVPWLLNSYEAVASVDKVLIRASRVLGASGTRTLTEVVLPTSVATLTTGARIALSNAWMTLVAAELLGATAGLGFVALNAAENLESAVLLMAMLLIGILGVLFSGCLGLVERHFSKWRAETTT